MGMDIETGKIRALDSIDQLKEKEVLFEVGGKVNLAGCQFEVTEIKPDPVNQITLTGIPNTMAQEAQFAAEPPEPPAADAGPETEK